MKLKSISIIKKIFLIPIIAVIVGVLSIALVSADIIKTSLLKEMQNNSVVVADTIAKRLEDNIKAQDVINYLLEDKIRMVSNIVIKNRGELSNEYLSEMAKKFGVSELHWLNKDGLMIYSTVEGYLDWKVPEKHPLFLIINGQSELMEEIRPDAEFGKLMKYGAVRSLDGSFVQVGLSAESVRKFTDEFSAQNLVQDVAFDEQIRCAELIDEKGIVIASNNIEKIGMKLSEKDLIYDSNNNEILEISFNEDSSNQIFTVIAPILKNGKNMGFIKLGYSMEAVYAAIKKSNLRMYMLGSLLMLMLVFVMENIQRKQIVKPIRDLNVDIQGISIEENILYRLPNHESNPFHLLRKTTNESLDKTQVYFESMVKTQDDLIQANDEIEATLGQLIASQEELTAANEELETALSQIIGSQEELKTQYDEIKAKEDYIRFLAYHDSLTELYNRRQFIEDLEVKLSKSKTGTVLLMDIDNFKYINDTLGHVYGDSVLRHVACLINESLPENASAYRFGGDEFLVHIEGNVKDFEIEEYIKTIVDILSDNSELEGIRNHITISIGVVCYPLDGLNVEELIIKADVAMYSAKKSGKNRCLIFNENMSTEFNERVQIGNKLIKAIETDSFKLLYQPVIEIRTGEIAYFEALIRMKNDTLSPAIFIPVAEESNLIILIGRWVIKEAIKQIRKWIELGLSPEAIAINLSPKQIYDDGLVEFLSKSLAEYEIDPSYIEIEVTESVLIDNIDEAIRTMEKIRGLGIKIALDDFGTGYSSLNYLTHIPVDKIKLDKSIKDKFIYLENIQVLDGLISVAHGLKLKVVAEGVEEIEEARRLMKGKCDYLQGYLFSRPVSADDAEKLFSKNYKEFLESK
ncbi:MAG: EAL domain-containing protein [Proteocatella sp.]